jgi:acetyl-CoA C-acetyltransferase
VLALHKLFERTSTASAHIDTFGVKEAFAAPAVAVRDAKLDPEKVNPYGGAIALGHPVGGIGAIRYLRLAKNFVIPQKL